MSYQVPCIFACRSGYHMLRELMPRCDRHFAESGSIGRPVSRVPGNTSSHTRLRQAIGAKVLNGRKLQGWYSPGMLPPPARHGDSLLSGVLRVMIRPSDLRGSALPRARLSSSRTPLQIPARLAFVRRHRFRILPLNIDTSMWEYFLGFSMTICYESDREETRD